MPSYDIPLLVTIEADNYNNALIEAKALTEGVSQTDEVLISVINNFETDNEGQRVIYLDPVE